MSDNPYTVRLLNTPALVSNMAALSGQWLIVAEAYDHIPLPWLCLFTKQDLRPCTIKFTYSKVVDGETRTLLGKFSMLNPSVSVSEAKANLAKSRPVFEALAGAEQGHQHWLAARAALEALPLDYLTIDPCEYLLAGGDDLKPGAWALVAAISSADEAIEAKRIIAGDGGLSGGFFSSTAFQPCERSVADVNQQQALLAKLNTCHLAYADNGYETLPLDLSIFNPPQAFWEDEALLAHGASQVCVRHGKAFVQDDKKHYWTSLTNLSDRPVRVKMFAGFGKHQNSYVLANDTKQWFTASDFIDWYGTASDGWIQPGDTVADCNNWGGDDDGFWAYWCENAAKERFVALAWGPRSPAAVTLSGLWTPASPDQLTTILKFVGAAREVARKTWNRSVGFDRQGVQWVDDFLEELHGSEPLADRTRLVQVLGAFVGECIINNLGGEWAIHNGEIGVRFDDKNSVFPLGKAEQHLLNGRAGGDSILGYYEALFILWPERRGDQAPIEAYPADAEMMWMLAEARGYVIRWQVSPADPGLETMRAEPPHWMPLSDPLYEILRQQQLLLTKGSIVWGAVVQANKLLFSPGLDDCPALLVYSPDVYFDARPQALRAIAHRIMELKNTTPDDPAERALADMVTGEMDRAMGWRLPQALSEREVYTAAFMVFRQHIPNGVLTCGRLPILTHPSTSAVMIVPHEFWPLKLIARWKDGLL